MKQESINMAIKVYYCCCYSTVQDRERETEREKEGKEIPFQYLFSGPVPGMNVKLSCFFFLSFFHNVIYP